MSRHLIVASLGLTFSFATAQASSLPLRKPILTVSEKTCDAINAAIHDSRLAKGGSVQLQAGTYICTTPVTLDVDHVDLAGAAPKKTQKKDAKGYTIPTLQKDTLIKSADGYALPTLVIGEVANNTVPKQTERWGIQLYPARGVADIRVMDLEVDGNLGPVTGTLECYNADEPNIAKRGVNCDGDGGKFIRNNAITIRKATSAVVKNVSSTNGLSGGLTTEKECEGLLVDTFYTSANRFDGFAGYETEHSTFKNMIVEKQPFSGISVDMGFINNTFQHVFAQNNNDNGVFSVQTTGNHYVDVQAINNRNNGFYMEGNRNGGSYNVGTCDGIVITDSVLKGNGANQLFINDPCQDIQVDNSILQTTAATQGCTNINPGAGVKFSGGQICK